MTRIEYRTAGGVVLHNGQMLLLDRPGRNEIRLPKGHIDPGETSAEAGLREVREETGYGDLEIVADLGINVVEFDYESDHYHRHEHYYLMRLRSEQRIERSAHDEADFHVLWVPMSEAAVQLTFESEQAVARKAIAVAAGGTTAQLFG